MVPKSDCGWRIIYHNACQVLGITGYSIRPPSCFYVVYINDINENITSSIQLFADDCVIYKTVTSMQEIEQLQDNLRKICEWTNRLQMKLNVDKCAVLRCTRYQTPIQYVYTLMDCNLDVKRLKLHTYLGVEIDNTMS